MKIRVKKTKGQKFHDGRDAYVAHHEAAHLVVAIALGLPFDGATIEADGHLGLAGGVRLSADQPGDQRVVAVTSLAGFVASEVALGSVITTIPPDELISRQDIINAGSIIKGLVEGEANQRELFLELTQQAEDLLMANRVLWERLTRVLIAQRSMSRQEILSVVEEQEEDS